MDNEQHLSYGTENDLNLNVTIAMHRSVNLLSRQESLLFRRHGLTTMQFAVLEVLYHKGDLTIGTIIEKILATGGNMTVVIQNLEKAKLIEKYPNPKDSRAFIIHLTEQGRQKIENIFPEHLANLKDFFQHLSTDQREDLIDLLKLVSPKYVK